MTSLYDLLMDDVEPKYPETKSQKLHRLPLKEVVVYLLDHPSFVQQDDDGDPYVAITPSSTTVESRLQSLDMLQGVEAPNYLVKEFEARRDPERLALLERFQNEDEVVHARTSGAIDSAMRLIGKQFSPPAAPHLEHYMQGMEGPAVRLDWSFVRKPRSTANTVTGAGDEDISSFEDILIDREFKSPFVVPPSVMEELDRFHEEGGYAQVYLSVTACDTYHVEFRIFPAPLDIDRQKLPEQGLRFVLEGNALSLIKNKEPSLISSCYSSAVCVPELDLEESAEQGSSWNATWSRSHSPGWVLSAAIACERAQRPSPQVPCTPKARRAGEALALRAEADRGRLEEATPASAKLRPDSPYSPMRYRRLSPGQLGWRNANDPESPLDFAMRKMSNLVVGPREVASLNISDNCLMASPTRPPGQSRQPVRRSDTRRDRVVDRHE